MNSETSKFEDLAIAYLTGQSTPAQVEAYQHLFETNDDFRATVKDIETWLAPLNAEIDARPAPTGLLESLMAEIDAPAIADEPMPVMAPVNETRVSRVYNDAVVANDRSASKWKWATLAASLVAVAALGSHLVSFEQDAPTSSQSAAVETAPPLLALLADDSQPELMAIVYNPATGRVVARMSNIVVPEESDLQLWLIREGAAGPVSLGVLERLNGQDQLEFGLPTSLNSGSDTLAVSLENRGGSTSAGPEGPVIYTGLVRPINSDI